MDNFVGGVDTDWTALNQDKNSSHVGKMMVVVVRDGRA
ncbi:hypothetical protein H4V99_002930 [Cryobacterium sp. CG_9.6]|nr:hypothetical protein [Cryobacterium sp. CG_9.6]